MEETEPTEPTELTESVVKPEKLASNFNLLHGTVTIELGCAELRIARVTAISLLLIGICIYGIAIELRHMSR